MGKQKGLLENLEKRLLAFQKNTAKNKIDPDKPKKQLGNKRVDQLKPKKQQLGKKRVDQPKPKKQQLGKKRVDQPNTSSSRTLKH